MSLEVLSHPVLPLFDTLPLLERLFVRARLWSAPLPELAARVEGHRVLEVGCGHGLICGMIAQGDPSREVCGVDPDARKIQWARDSVGRLPNLTLQVGTVGDLARTMAGAFDSIVVADVLYLLPWRAWAGFLDTCAQLLRPGGQLLLKEAEADGSWKHWKCVAQERLMVHLLGRTQSSGGMTLVDPPRLRAVFQDAELRIDTVQRYPGFTTPHVLYEARSTGRRRGSTVE